MLATLLPLMEAKDPGFAVFASHALWVVFWVFLLLSFIERVSEMRGWLARRRSRREFDAFETSLLESSSHGGPSRFLTGETKLPTEVTIHLPGFVIDKEFLAGIDAGLGKESLGYVVRQYQASDSSCVDVFLHDFVFGVDCLRDFLMTNRVPTGTVIEYDNGDLDIYE